MYQCNNAKWTATKGHNLPAGLVTVTSAGHGVRLCEETGRLRRGQCLQSSEGLHSDSDKEEDQEGGARFCPVSRHQVLPQVRHRLDTIIRFAGTRLTFYSCSRHPEEKDPEITPSKLLMVTRTKVCKGLPWWDRDLLREFQIEEVLYIIFYYIIYLINRLTRLHSRCEQIAYVDIFQCFLSRLTMLFHKLREFIIKKLHIHKQTK